MIVEEISWTAWWENHLPDINKNQAAISLTHTTG